MVNVQIATNNINLIKKLINEIMTLKTNVRVAKITTNEEETIQVLNNKNIDVIFLDLRMIKKSANIMLDMIKEDKKQKYKDSIIIISDIFEPIEQLVKNEMIIDYILEKSSKDEIMYKVNRVIGNKDIESKRREIIKELEYIRYNTEYKGTSYLVDTILQVYINKKLMLDNLQKDIYPIISNIYKKSINTIRCNIRHATDSMYCECDMNILKEYFGLVEDEKPTTKEVIYAVLNKIS